jgi:hypothetical protein
MNSLSSNGDGGRVTMSRGNSTAESSRQASRARAIKVCLPARLDHSTVRPGPMSDRRLTRNAAAMMLMPPAASRCEPRARRAPRARE